MKIIAVSFLLLFTTLTVVVSSYFLWQDADFEVTMSIEEEEEEGKTVESSISFDVIFISNNMLLNMLSDEKTKALSNINEVINYEIVYLTSPFSPPDVI
jgi:hypothetical protein